MGLKIIYIVYQEHGTVNKNAINSRYINELLQSFYINNIREDCVKEGLLHYKETHSFSCLNRLSEEELNGFMKYIFE